MAKGVLLQHRDFRLLWGGETVSELVSQVSLLAIPLLAVRTLHATAFLGSVAGLRPTLWIGAAGEAVPGIWLLASPMRTMREFPEAPE